MYRLLIVLSLTTLVSCAPKSSLPTNTKLSEIMNGQNVLASDPITASIVGVYNTKLNEICTGSLIAPNIVLTAAHCAPSKAADVKIIFATDIDDTMNSRELDVIQENVLTATDYKVNPKWNPNNETVQVDTGDIAVIKFKGNIPAGYKPATFLADKTALKIGNLVTVAGFGVNFVDMKEINPKKYKNLDDAINGGEVTCEDDNKGNHLKCYKIERDGDGVLRTTEAPISFIYETEVSLNEKKSGTCNGDSGGPAYIKKDGAFYLFGVTSRGSNMCDETGVYTNALVYKSWIDETIKTLK